MSPVTDLSNGTSRNHLFSDFSDFFPNFGEVVQWLKTFAAVSILVAIHSKVCIIAFIVGSPLLSCGKSFIVGSETRFAYNHLKLQRVSDMRTCLRTVVGSDGFQEWIETRNATAQEEARGMRARIRDEDGDEMWANIGDVVAVMQPIYNFVRMSDRQGYTLGDVYKDWIETEENIEKVRVSTFLTTERRENVRAQWMRRESYFHSPQMSVGYLLNPHCHDHASEDFADPGNGYFATDFATVAASAAKMKSPY